MDRRRPAAIPEQPITSDTVGEKVATGDWMSDVEVEDSSSESENSSPKPTHATSKRGYEKSVYRLPVLIIRNSVLTSGVTSAQNRNSFI